MARIAVLDDYQGVALSIGGWERLPADSEIEAFRDHLIRRGRAGAASAALRCHRRDAGAHSVPAQPAQPPAQPAAADHDRHAQRRLRHAGCKGSRNHRLRHRWSADADRGADLGPDHRLRAPHRRGGPRHARWPLADDHRPDLHGKTLGCLGLGQPRLAGREGRPGLRHERHRLEPEPDAGARRPGRRPAGHARTSCSPRPTSSASTSCSATVLAALCPGESSP